MNDPRAGRLYLVSSQRIHHGSGERSTRIFRFFGAAERYADAQRALGHHPVTIWETDIPHWRECDR